MATTNRFFRLLSIIASLAMIFSYIQSSNVQAQNGDGLKREVKAESGKVSLMRSEAENCHII